MKYLRFPFLLFAVTILGGSAVAAAALKVPAGCAAPPAVSLGNVFYVDPVKGSASGNGSLLRPWNSLQAIVGNNALFQKSSIKSGDTILLMNGNYGDVSISGIANTGFVTLAAAPGQTPVLSSLQVSGSKEWIIQGLTFRALASTYSAFIGVSGNTKPGASSDIIIDGNDLASQDDVSSWKAADWIKSARYAGIQVDGGDQYSTFAKCVAVTNNSLRNIRLGIDAFADNMLVDSNVIDNFGDDGLDYAGNNLAITNNQIRNSHDIGDSNHNDAMQGQVGRGIGGVTVYNNITISGNIVIAQAVRNLPFPGLMQGIDAFDMDWSNVNVINNIVVSNAWHGISFYSTHGGLIANNTVLASSDFGTWLGVFDQSHQGTSSNNVVVRNNIVSNLNIGIGNSTIMVDHNLVGGQLAWTVNGQMQYLKQPGSYGSENMIDPNGLTQAFKNFNAARASFNVHLQPGTLAVGTGNVQAAPPTIAGTKRKSPVDLGAYVYTPSTTDGN